MKDHPEMIQTLCPCGLWNIWFIHFSCQGSLLIALMIHLRVLMKIWSHFWRRNKITHTKSQITAKFSACHPIDPSMKRDRHFLSRVFLLFGFCSLCKKLKLETKFNVLVRCKCLQFSIECLFVVLFSFSVGLICTRNRILSRRWQNSVAFWFFVFINGRVEGGDDVAGKVHGSGAPVRFESCTLRVTDLYTC